MSSGHEIEVLADFLETLGHRPLSSVLRTRVVWVDREDCWVFATRELARAWALHRLQTLFDGPVSEVPMNDETPMVFAVGGVPSLWIERREIFI